MSRQGDEIVQSPLHDSENSLSLESWEHGESGHGSGEERGPRLQAARSWNLDPIYQLRDTGQIVNFLICRIGLEGLSRGIKSACKNHSIEGALQLA